MNYTDDFLIDFITTFTTVEHHSPYQNIVIKKKKIYSDEEDEMLSVNFNYNSLQDDNRHYTGHLYYVDDINDFIKNQRIKKINKLKECLKKETLFIT